MKQLVILPILFLFSGCSAEVFAPDTISIKDRLGPELQQLLEATIKDQVCIKIEAQGFECDVEHQSESITFDWVYEENEDPVVDYELLFCLKDRCPVPQK